jgi:hypothetical protein
MSPAPERGVGAGRLKRIPVHAQLRSTLNEADGRAAFHAVDQHLAQPLDLAITDGLQTSNLKMDLHCASIKR